MTILIDDILGYNCGAIILSHDEGTVIKHP